MQSLGLSFILVLSKDSEAITAVGQSCYVYVGESGYMHTPNVDMVKENVEGCVCTSASGCLSTLVYEHAVDAVRRNRRMCEP